ncbi:MAG: NAD(P)/FAD-dependent oxidoreductase [Candidatus Nanohaloarchaea archaeon]
MSPEVRDLVVVGGASAAMTSAIYAVRSGLDVLVVADEYGGQINNTDVVENYLGFKSISGPELADRFLDHMRDYDIDEEVGSPVVDIRKDDDIFEVETGEGNVFRARSVIIATGGSRRRLDIPGEEEYRNKGVAYCAVCDGPLYQGEDVAVIGGGYAGTEAAVYLSDIADTVYILNRSSELSGEEITIDQVEDAENVEVINDAETREIHGDDMVTGIEYEKEGETRELEVTGVFVEIGTVPNSDITDLVEKDDGGYIHVDEDMETATTGLFAAGEGCQAGLNASDYVKEKKAESE